MADIADLKPLLDAIIAGNDDQARVSFHTYLTSKLQASIAASRAPESVTESVKDYKKKRVAGLYSYDHYEHPSGSFVQIRHKSHPSGQFHAVHSDAGGKHTEFDTLEKLKKHVNDSHKVSEAITPGQMRHAQDRWESDPNDYEPQEGDPMDRVDQASNAFYELLPQVRDGFEADHMRKAFEASKRRFNDYGIPRDEYEQDDIDKVVSSIEQQVREIAEFVRDQNNEGGV